MRIFLVLQDLQRVSREFQVLVVAVHVFNQKISNGIERHDLRRKQDLKGWHGLDARHVLAVDLNTSYRALEFRVSRLVPVLV